MLNFIARQGSLKSSLIVESWFTGRLLRSVNRVFRQLINSMTLHSIKVLVGRLVWQLYGRPLRQSFK